MVFVRKLFYYQFRNDFQTLIAKRFIYWGTLFPFYESVFAIVSVALSWLRRLFEIHIPRKYLHKIFATFQFMCRCCAWNQAPFFFVLLFKLQSSMVYNSVGNNHAIVITPSSIHRKFAGFFFSSANFSRRHTSLIIRKSLELYRILST